MTASEPAVALVINALAEHGCAPKGAGRNWTSRCPAHEDRNPSLSVSPGSRGRDVVLHCHAGCAPDDVLAALSLTWTDIAAAAGDGGTSLAASITDIYPYVDEDGRLLFEVLRLTPKQFRQRRPDGSGGHIWSTAGVRRVLYRLPQVIQAVHLGAPIFLVEGEKDANNLQRHLDATANGRGPGALGVATTTPGGAGKWTAVPDAGTILAGARVLIIADNDPTGIQHALTEAWDLRLHGADVSVYTPAEGHKDITDHLSAGHGLDELQPLDEEAYRDTSPTTPERSSPTPLPGIEGSTPPFPTDALPEWIAAPVRAIAASLQLPDDLPAAIALGCLAATCQGRVKVRIPGSKWTEHVNLYLTAAVPPGAGKSPAFKILTRPLLTLEKERAAAARTAQIDAEGTQRILEGKLKNAEARAIKGEPGLDREAARIRHELADLEVPHPLQELADDATPEALADLMANNGGRLAVLSAEGQVFDAMAGQYVDRGGKANLDIYLKGFSGDSLRQNRIKRDAIAIEECLLTICVTTQPAVLESLSAAPQLAQRGATARFMYAVPPVNIGARDRSRILDTIDTKGWDDQLTAISRRLHQSLTARSIDLDPDAVKAFMAWDQAIEHRCAAGADLAPLAEWVQKLRSCVLRVAGLLAVANDQDAKTITAETLASALAIGSYWLDHAKTVHRMWGVEEPALALAKTVLRWAQQQPAHPDDPHHRPIVTGREIHRAMFRKVEGVKVLEEPLTTLAEYGWLDPLDGLDATGGVTLGKPGQPSPRFAVEMGTDGAGGDEMNRETRRGVSPVTPSDVYGDDTKGDEVQDHVALVACPKGGGDTPPYLLGTHPETTTPTLSPPNHATSATSATGGVNCKADGDGGERTAEDVTPATPPAAPPPRRRSPPIDGYDDETTGGDAP